MLLAFSCFFYFVKAFATTRWRHKQFSSAYVQSLKQFQLKCVRDVLSQSYWSELVYSPDYFSGHTWLISLSKMTSSLWNWVFFTLIQRDDVKWMCATLNEGYLRAANRGSIILQIPYRKITSHPLMKRVIFWSSLCLLLCDCRSTKLSLRFSGNLPAMYY